MKKYIIFTMILTLAFFGVSRNFKIVQADDTSATIPVTTGSDSDTTAPAVVTDAPVSQGSNQVEASTSIPDATGSDSDASALVTTATSTPVSQGTNGDETGAIIPSTQGTNGNETGPIIPVSQGSNGGDSTTTSTSTTLVTPPNNGGGGGSSGGGNIDSAGGGGASGGFSAGGGASIVPLAVNVPIANAESISTSSCPFIGSYLKFGGDNSSSDVAKLQIFLKDYDDQDVSVTGVFDQATFDAVVNFQRQYLSDIMGPWDATKPSGFVYITTINKINQLVCNQPLTLTPAEQSIIQSYITNLNQVSSTGTAGPSQNLTSTSTIGNPDIGLNPSSDNSGLTASAGNATILQKFWQFIVNLFK